MQRHQARVFIRANDNPDQAYNPRVPTWARLVVVVGAARVTVALAFYLSGLYNADIAAPIPTWAYAALMISFSAIGLFLVFGNQDDSRAGWLGGVLLLIAVPLSTRFLAQTPFTFADAMLRLEAAAFLPAFLWRFVSQFPSPLSRSVDRLARAMAGASALFAIAAFAINLSVVIWRVPATELGWRALLATGRVINDVSVYWPTLFLLSTTAAIALLVRMFSSTGSDRQRVRIFLSGLGLGVLPLFIEILIEAAWPAYRALVHSPAVEPWIAILLFGPLATVPVVTTYSVLYDRVVETRWILRAAIQHALAKYSIAIATAVPISALGLYFYQHRTEPLVELLSGPRQVLLLAAIAIGTASLRARRHLLAAIDRRFFREAYDAQLLLSALMQDDMVALPLGEIASRLRSEFERALHARADLFVVDDEGATLRDPTGQRQPLSRRSVLLSLAMADARPMDVQMGSTSVLSRLPEPDRSWIAAGGYQLVLVIRSRLGESIGLLALTGKRSELPFSDSDRRSIAAIAATLALAIENDRLRRVPDPITEMPARECTSCSRMHAADAPQCSCGGLLVEGHAPHLLRGVFRFEQRIGAGGMGVVYRATDINLGREVAIKTLPRVTPDHAAQLKREAQAMASVVHLNLAVIYGIESWRGTPFLVEEYLAGGMLSHHLRRGPLPVGEAIDLGIALSGVLGQLHASGIIHCDVKSSNIGFSSAGVVKLVDFGLAYLLRDSGAELAATITASGDEVPGELGIILTKRGLMGTPAYMSPEASVAATPSPGFDLWALSVVLFESITGQRPFVGANADEVFLKINHEIRPDALKLRPDCPVEVARFFDRSLALSLGARPQSANELHLQLLALRSSIA